MLKEKIQTTPKVGYKSQLFRGVTAVMIKKKDSMTPKNWLKRLQAKELQSIKIRTGGFLGSTIPQ